MLKEIKYNGFGNLILITIILLAKLFNLNCSGCGEEIIVMYPEITYDGKTLINQDYIFNNEGLNRPLIARMNPFNEIVVLDIGNVCLYVFSYEGKFIRKIGRAGQGPGEMLRPIYFDLDLNGDIYVYDSKNGRITIFSREGKYVNSFRASGVISLFVNFHNEIVTNIPKRGYYFTIFSRDGKILREIGVIPEVEKYKDKNYGEYCGQGRIIMNEYENYYVFLTSMAIVRVFDKKGEFLFERSMDEIKEIREFKEKAKTKIDPDDHYKDWKERHRVFLNLFYDVIYMNGQIYLIKITSDRDPKTNNRRFAVYALDDNLNINKKIYLPVEIFKPQEYIRIYILSFEVLNNENIILPILYNSEVFLYNYPSNNYR